MYFHHPIMNTLWGHGGQFKRRKKTCTEVRVETATEVDKKINDIPGKTKEKYIRTVKIRALEANWENNFKISSKK